MFDRNFSLSRTSSAITLPDASATEYTWIGKYGAGTIAVSPGPIIARHMWLKPSFEPRQTMTSSSGSSRTPNRLKYFARHFAAEVGDAVRLAVAVVARVAGRLGQLLDDEVLGRIGRVAHAEVDHVVAGAPLVVEQRVDAAEQVRRQPRDALGHLNLERRLDWRRDLRADRTCAGQC